MGVERGVAIGQGGLGGFIMAAIGGLSARFYLGRRVDQVWAASRYPRLKDVGTVNGVTILPLKEQ